MVALVNPRQEKFARLVAADMPVPQAYAKAGYAPDIANAHKLGKRDLIAGRVSELQAEALEQEGVSVSAVISGMAAIAFSDPRSFFEWDESGVRVRAGAKLTSEEAKVITQVEQTSLRGEKTIRVKLADRLRALEILGRWAGLDKLSAPDPEPHMHIHVESPLEKISEQIALLAARHGAIEGKAQT